MRLSLAVTITLAVLHVAPSPGAAQGQRTDEAEVIIRRGVELRKRGEDEAALREFRRAYGIAPTPRAAAQMGLAEQALGRWPDAETHLAEALAVSGNPWIEKHRPVLEESLRTVRGRVGRLTLSGTPAGAEVWVDGHRKGALPIIEPLRLLPGPARLEVRAPGHVPWRASVPVAAGEVTQLSVMLEKERPPEPAIQVATKVPPEPAPPATEPAWQPIALRAGLIATAAALAVGGGGLLYGEVKTREANSAGCTETDGVVRGPARCKGLYDSADTGTQVGVVGLVGAGILGVTTAVLYFAF